jgi:hypothetical protein
LSPLSILCNNAISSCIHPRCLVPPPLPSPYASYFLFIPFHSLIPIAPVPLHDYSLPFYPHPLPEFFLSNTFSFIF